MSSEEVILESVSQQIVKFLLAEHEFLEKWQAETRRGLEDDEGIDLRKPSTSTSSGHSTTRKSTAAQSPITVAIQTSVAELTSTIQYVVDLFESNVDPRNCYISSSPSSKCPQNRQFLNRDTGELFDAGLKVEQLKTLTSESKEQRNAHGAHIQTACRRVGLVLKAFGKRFQGQPSLEVSSLVPILHRFCRLFYTLSAEVQRFSANFKTKLDRKTLRSSRDALENAANEFNSRVMAEVEMIENHLKKEERRRTKAPPIISQAPPTIRAASEATEYASQTRHQRAMASSIQQVIQKRREDSEDVTTRSERFRRPHVAGSIATSIIPKRRGFLMDDNLQKARQRIARVAPKQREGRNQPPECLNIDKSSNDEVLARKMADLVMEDMRRSLKF